MSLTTSFVELEVVAARWLGEQARFIEVVSWVGCEPPGRAHAISAGVRSG